MLYPEDRKGLYQANKASGLRNAATFFLSLGTVIIFGLLCRALAG